VRICGRQGMLKSCCTSALGGPAHPQKR
jgi:hypothetical protein